MRPLAIDLFTGLHGWGEGLIATGWRVIGVDIVDMSAKLGIPKPPHFELILADVMEIDGAQFADADLIVSSSPCTDYAYMAMPWKRSKAKAAAILADETGAALRKLNALYDAQFRIQREASEAKGRYIPMIVENVRGARPWVGRAAWNFGSYYLWGDVPALMPQPVKATKVPGFRFDGSGKSFQTASVEGMKVPSVSGRSPSPGHGARFTSRDRGVEAEATDQAEVYRPAKTGDPERPRWFNDGPRTPGSLASSSSSSSPARKAASAEIAKIPLALSTHIGRVFYPREERPADPIGEAPRSLAHEDTPTPPASGPPDVDDAGRFGKREGAN